MAACPGYGSWSCDARLTGPTGTQSSCALVPALCPLAAQDYAAFRVSRTPLSRVTWPRSRLGRAFRGMPFWRSLEQLCGLLCTLWRAHTQRVIRVSGEPQWRARCARPRAPDSMPGSCSAQGAARAIRCACVVSTALPVGMARCARQPPPSVGGALQRGGFERANGARLRG